MLTFSFKGLHGEMTIEETLTSGTVGKMLNLEFDAFWNNWHKIIVFVAGDVCRSYPLIQNNTAIPDEVLAHPGHRLYVGIYGYDEDMESSMPSVMVKGPMIQFGADPTQDPTCQVPELG